MVVNRIGERKYDMKELNNTNKSRKLKLQGESMRRLVDIEIDSFTWRRDSWGVVGSG